MGLFTRHTGFLLPRAAYNASEPMIIPMTSSAQLCLHECVRISSVAVVSGIYYSDHWWLQAYLSDLHPPHAELAQPV